MILIDDYKKILNDTTPQIAELEVSTGYETLAGQIEELEMHTQQPDFWNDMENSQKVLQEIKQLKGKVARLYISSRSHYFISQHIVECENTGYHFFTFFFQLSAFLSGLKHRNDIIFRIFNISNVSSLSAYFEQDSYSD